MPGPKVLILYGYGINCDKETHFAFKMVGAQAEDVHINELRNKKRKLKDYHIAAFPGGFLHGDDIAAGRVMANVIKTELLEGVLEFINDGKLLIGICNGFQVLVKAGLLPGFDGNYGKQEVTLTYNDSGKFEDRWVYLKKPDPSSMGTPSNQKPENKCIWTKGIEKLYLPVRHGEGKFIPKDKDVLARLYENNQVVVKYVGEEGEENPDYPWNPNGSVDDIAGICDETGRIFGLMPHPEAYFYKTNHPRWMRENLPEEGQGVKIFRNAVNYFK